MARLGDRALFPDLADRVYLNHAAISPPSMPVRDACRRALDDYAALGAGAWLRYRDQRDALRGQLAALIGADTQDLALVASTSQGLLDVALCFPWQRGDRVVLLEGEFPANVTAWQQAAVQFGLDVTFLPVDDFVPRGPGLERLEQVLRGGVRLVAVSAVQFQTGLRMPLRAMAERCHAHGAELCVDAIQAVGVVPIDVRETGVDYLVAGSHKGLMAPEGAGFLYVHPDRVGALRPLVAGWLSHEDGARFLFEGRGHLRYDRPIRRTADFLEFGAMNTLGFAGLGASVAILSELGVAAIYDHVQAFHDVLERGLVDLGFTSLRRPEPEARSSILAVRPPVGGASLQEVWERLGAAGIACSMPDGNLRFAPHWPNDVSQVPVVLEAAAGALR
ncbi:MAG: aminotransferase class V-fold PLP-dependent enzyme [Planctomycetota bacterium]